MDIEQAKANIDFLKEQLANVDKQKESLLNTEQRLMISLGESYKELRELEDNS